MKTWKTIATDVLDREASFRGRRQNASLEVVAVARLAHEKTRRGGPNNPGHVIRSNPLAEIDEFVSPTYRSSIGDRTVTIFEWSSLVER
ncbi:MAG: hypothetical protein ACOCY7_01775 [Halodesulfurarchaeum sp.]